MAGRPASQFNIIKEFTRKRLTRQPCHKVSVVAPTDVSADVSDLGSKDAVDAGFCEEPFADNGELLSSLSPLLSSMKVFGLYFRRPDRLRRRTGDTEWNPGTAAVGSGSKKLRVYATVVLALMWLNVVRSVLIFTCNDHFGSILLMKIVIFMWSGLMAILQTTCYCASHTGQLLKILLKLPVTRDCVRGARRAAVFLTALIWATLAAFTTIGACIFFYTQEEYNFILAPLVTYIEVPEDKIKTAKMVGFLGYLIVFPGVFFAHAMTVVIVYVFYNQFKKLKRNFRRSIGEKGQFNGDLSLFRRRHK